MVENVHHLGLGFSDAETPQRVTVKGNVQELADAFFPQVLEESALADAEEELVPAALGVGGAATGGPARGQAQ